MANLRTIVASGKTQAGGAFEVTLNTDPSPDTVTISVLGGSSTTGTIALGIRTYVSADEQTKSAVETLRDSNGNAVTIDLSALKSVVIEKQRVGALVFTPSGVSGSYGVVVMQAVTLDD